MVWLCFAFLACSELVDVPAVRPVADEGPLADVRCRLRDVFIMAGLDAVGQTHEGVHGLNVQIRNGRGGTGHVNACYLGHGKAVVLPEPRGFRTSEVVSGSSPILALSCWDDCPLYLLDELSAYIGGTVCGEVPERGIRADGRAARSAGRGRGSARQYREDAR